MAFDEVFQQVVSLDIQMVNSLVHSLDSTLRGTDQILVSNNLVNKLLLRETIQDFLRIGLVKLPLLEVNGQRVVQTVEDESGVFFGHFSGSDVKFPLVQCFGNDIID